MILVEESYVKQMPESGGLNLQLADWKVLEAVANSPRIGLFYLEG